MSPYGAPSHAIHMGLAPCGGREDYRACNFCLCLTRGIVVVALSLFLNLECIFFGGAQPNGGQQHKGNANRTGRVVHGGVYAWLVWLLALHETNCCLCVDPCLQFRKGVRGFLRPREHSVWPECSSPMLHQHQQTDRKHTNHQHHPHAPEICMTTVCVHTPGPPR